ncbi:MAG: hypothetical protein J5598_01740, partial [Clostridia bacterium]|nr:hypothetical protein [Clostridia bacterium]
FNIPSFNGGYAICGVLSINSVSKANTPQAGVLPKIIGSLWTGDQTNTVSAKFHTPTGAFATKSGTANYTAPGNASANTSWGFDFDASRSSSIYSGTDNKVFPTRYATRFFIKYI